MRDVMKQQSISALAVVAWFLSLALQGCWEEKPEKQGDAQQQRRGSFLVHGNLQSRSCQQAIADSMDSTMKQLGDVQFVINVGDSFYPNGVISRSDKQWDTKWRNVYSPTLRSIPWYSVYGNHDYISDPCICSEDVKACAQFNDDEKNTDLFYMPNVSWYKEHTNLDTEVIALDVNFLWANHTCHYTACPQACEANLKNRMDAAFKLFYERVAASNASNWVVFSHYPTDYFPRAQTNTSMPVDENWPPSWFKLEVSREELPDRFHSFLTELSNASRSGIVYFGGHRHNVDQSSTASTAPQTNWLVGGGGGWGTEAYGDQQGFVVGEISDSGQITTRAVTVNFNEFCNDGRFSTSTAPGGAEAPSRAENVGRLQLEFYFFVAFILCMSADGLHSACA
eukprot:TRINITY_DN7769_c0_g1_i3.p1 TRINITY_DN7769_c0_g1~~TRINITY_DN7769_c0_g1_i3.p1  ORF type:complete len:396 (+),score=65.91 TRINITY_DN7769_c0_g1_i3:22-1209(+)